ncbi:MAG: hypothetical protein JWM08_142 [Candidatus Angelobacter sp.]|nr:hypothetical protein [Candidatus Angelobacter sp.]
MRTMEDDSAKGAEKVGLYRESLLHSAGLWNADVATHRQHGFRPCESRDEKRHLDIATERLSYITLGAPIPIKSRL